MAVDTVDQTEVKPANTAKAVEAVGADFSLPGLRKQVLAKEKEYKDITGKKATEMRNECNVEALCDAPGPASWVHPRHRRRLRTQVSPHARSVGPRR